MRQEEKSIEKQNQNSVLQTLKEFAKFFSSMHGIFTAASIIFQFLNVFLKAIPMDRANVDPLTKTLGPGFANFTPESVALITFIITLFSITYVFGERYNYISNTLRYSLENFKKSSIYLLIIGISSLVSYLYIYFTTMASCKMDLLLLSLYVTANVSIAVSFMILAMIEYYSIRIDQSAPLNKTSK